MTDGSDIRVTVERHRSAGSVRTLIRVRRGKGPEETYESLEQAPPEIQAIVADMDKEFEEGERQRRQDARTERRRRRGEHGPGLVFVDESRQRLRLTYYRFWWLAAVMAVVIPIFLWYMVRTAWQSGWPVVLLWSVFSLFFLFAFYGALVFVVNRTIIEVSDKRLSVRHAPLPWFGQPRLKSAAIEQLYSTVTRRSRHTTAFRLSRRRAIAYHLHAVTKDGRDVPLVRDVGDADTVLFMERQIERWLGIEDWPEMSEHAREVD